MWWRRSRIVPRVLWVAAQLAGRVSRALGGRLAAALWFTPWSVPKTSHARDRERTWLRGTEPVSIEGLHGFQAGRGPAVFLIHGWGDSASSLGAFVAPLVGAGCRVVGIDLPAHGGTGGRRTDLLEAAAAVKRAIDHIDPVAVVAHSLGAAVTVIAVEEARGVRGVVLLAPAVRPRHVFEFFASQLRLPARARDGLRSQLERRFGAGVWERFSGDRIASRLSLPALIVHDHDDPQVSHADAETLHRAWRGSRLVATEGLGHVRLLRDERVLGEALDFVERLVADTAGVRAVSAE